MIKSIVFVCLGNICRSPIAEGCARKKAETYNIEINVESSGTSSWHIGEAPCDNSIQVCKDNDVIISHFKASQFTKQDISKYDLVIALDDSNINDLKNLGVTNLVKLGDYGYNSEDVPDPYFFDGFEGFDKVFTMIDTCITELFEREIK